jgi:hypothetical protein
MTMTHGAEHEEAVMRHVMDGDGDQAAVCAQAASCEACVTFIARLVEDAMLVGSPRAARAEALLDEVLVWLAVQADGQKVPTE